MIPKDRAVIELWGKVLSKISEDLGYIKIEYDGVVIYNDSLTSLSKSRIITAYEGPANKKLKITLYGSAIKAGAQQDYTVLKAQTAMTLEKYNLYEGTSINKFTQVYDLNDNVYELDLTDDIRKVIIYPNNVGVLSDDDVKRVFTVRQFTY